MAQGSAILDVKAKAPETQLGYDGANNDPPTPHYLGGADDESGFRTQAERDTFMQRLLTAADKIARRGLLALNPNLYDSDALHIYDRRGFWGQPVGATALGDQQFGIRPESA